jgi:uncharacterized protein (TIRG00374 family)
MSSKLLSYLKYIAILIISFGLLTLAFHGISVKAILNEIIRAKFSWLLLSIGISLIAFASRAFRWQLLIESLGHSPSFKKTLYSLMIGYFANLAFPRLGEVTRCGTLSKAESIPFSSLLGTVIVERVIDVLSLLVCLLLAFIIEFKRIGNFLNETIIYPLTEKCNQLIKSPLAITLSILFIVVSLMSIIYFFKKPEENKDESKFLRLLKGLVDGLRSISKLKRPWLFIFHSVFIWLLSFLGMYICFFALPATSQLGLGAALVLLVVGGLGMAAPVQGGIGAFHLLVSQGLMLYGLSQQDGLAYATLVHALSLVVVVVCGIISLMLLFAENKKKNTADAKLT